MKLLRIPALLLLAILFTAGVTACGHDDHSDHDDHHHDHDDHDDHDHEAAFDLALLDPTTDEVLADVHGDHWHGELPELYVGDELEVGISLADSEGNAIELGGDYTLHALVAPGSPEGIVGMEV